MLSIGGRRTLGDSGIKGKSFLFIFLAKSLILFVFGLDKNVPAMIEAQEASLPREAQESAKKYIHRIVPDILSLREKAIIFEHDLDDRVIELMKVVYCGQFEEQKGITVQHIFFSANGDNWQFELFGESELLAIAPFDKNLYTSLQHAPKRKLKPIRNDRRYFVDREWAVKSIE